jgi:hypothetical protein
MFSAADQDMLASSDLADLSNLMVRESNLTGDSVRSVFNNNTRDRGESERAETQARNIIDVLTRQKNKKQVPQAKLAAINAFKHAHNQKQEGAPAELMNNPLYSRTQGKEKKKSSGVGRAIGLFKKKSNVAV